MMKMTCVKLIPGGTVALVLALLLAMSAAPEPVFSATGSRQAKKPVALEKEAFFVGISNGRVTIIEQKSYLQLYYSMAPSAKMTFAGKDIDSNRVPKHSIVRLILLDDIVQEIILVRKAS
jgi:hypothetical protein